MKTVLFLVGISLAVIRADIRAKRDVQPNCDPLQGIINPCTGTTDVRYIPHPTDNTKFLQCGGGRMFLVNCPKGEIYSQASTTCLPPTPVVTTKPPTVPGVQVANPCTPQNLALGIIYFPVAENIHKFIECGPDGTPNLLDCPAQLEWDQTKKSCLYTFSQTQTASTQSPGALQASGVTKNPCRGQVQTTAGQFFPHPDPTKFIQCDLAGNAYELPCPTGLVWNQFSSTCLSPYLVFAPRTTPSSI